jgi:hypothetical protein
VSNEISVSVKLAALKGNFKFEREFSNVKMDMAGSGRSYPGSVVVGTTEGSLDMTGFTTVLIRNMDPTNYVRIGKATGSYMLRMLPGGVPNLVTLDGAQTLYMLANTAPCTLEIQGIQS